VFLLPKNYFFINIQIFASIHNTAFLIFSETLSLSRYDNKNGTALISTKVLVPSSVFASSVRRLIGVLRDCFLKYVLLEENYFDGLILK